MKIKKLVVGVIVLMLLMTSACSNASIDQDVTEDILEPQVTKVPVAEAQGKKPVSTIPESVATDTESIEYVLGEKVDDVLMPTGIELSKDKNIYSLILQPVLNPNSDMMKRVLVQAGDGQVWSFISDEAGQRDKATFISSGPNPLSYLVAGSTMNLLSALKKNAMDMAMQIDNMTVEQEFIFGLRDMLASIDSVTTNVVIDSKENAADLTTLYEAALNDWTLGEGLRNATSIDGSLQINGENFAMIQQQPGYVVADAKGVNGQVLIHQAESKKAPAIMEPTAHKIPEPRADGKPGPPDVMNIPLTAVAESLGDAKNPYLNKVTIIQAPWVYYSDDAELYGGDSTLPNSIHYYLAGTSFCLGTQLTLVEGMLKHENLDKRIEMQLVVKDTEVETLQTVVLAKTDQTMEETEEWFKTSVGMCFAGAGLRDAIPLINSFYLNGNLEK